MIDIHSHVLPMVDDGAGSIEECIAILDGFAALGYTQIVATPHWAVGMPDVSREIANAAIKAAADRGVKLSLARECRIHPKLLDHVLQNSWLRIDQGNAVLVELPWGAAPDFTVSVFRSLIMAEFQPVLVHPERHAQLWESNSPLERLVDSGIPLQLNIRSLVGGHGRETRDRAISLLERGYVAIVATDIHSATELDTSIPDAHSLLNNLVGEAIAARVTSSNPRALIEGRPVKNLCSEQIEINVERSWIEPEGFLARLRKKLVRQSRNRG